MQRGATMGPHVRHAVVTGPSPQRRPLGGATASACSAAPVAGLPCACVNTHARTHARKQTRKQANKHASTRTPFGRGTGNRWVGEGEQHSPNRACSQSQGLCLLFPP